jgi:hypothetical protein
MNYKRCSAFALSAFTAIALACSQNPSSPSAPSSAGRSNPDAAADGSTLKATAPTPVSPVGGEEIDDLDPDLVITNSTGRFVQGVVLSYIFEVFEEGELVYQSPPIPQGPDGRTTHEIGIDLDEDEEHTWRARAVYQGRQGPVSTGAAFRTTAARFGGPSCAGARVPLAIVQCRRAQWGFIEEHDMPTFLRGIAKDLNDAGQEEGPYGILIKTGGASCGGYSCDIICSGQGNDQDQYDVLIDGDGAQIPVWNEVHDLAVRPCEIVQ